MAIERLPARSTRLTINSRLSIYWRRRRARPRLACRSWRDRLSDGQGAPSAARRDQQEGAEHIVGRAPARLVTPRCRRSSKRPPGPSTAAGERRQVRRRRASPAMRRGTVKAWNRTEADGGAGDPRLWREERRRRCGGLIVNLATIDSARAGMRGIDWRSARMEGWKVDPDQVRGEGWGVVGSGANRSSADGPTDMSGVSLGLIERPWYDLADRHPTAARNSGTQREEVPRGRSRIASAAAAPPSGRRRGPCRYRGRSDHEKFDASPRHFGSWRGAGCDHPERPRLRPRNEVGLTKWDARALHRLSLRQRGVNSCASIDDHQRGIPMVARGIERPPRKRRRSELRLQPPALRGEHTEARCRDIRPPAARYRLDVVGASTGTWQSSRESENRPRVDHTC